MAAGTENLASSEPDRQVIAPEVCALADCDVPLPVRALDEQGRAKGGRRPRYCGKAHADAASRQRRARDVASVADPLALARSAGEAFLPGARHLAAQLSDLIARFDQAEAGALARVQGAEQDAAAAVEEAAAAREAADTAEQARRQALATARHDRQARDNAVREAERARQEAEQIRTTAWEQIAAHERGRGQAEAARIAAQASADALIGQNRQLRTEKEQALTTGAELTARITAAAEAHQRAEGENRALLARIEVVERLRDQDGDRLRDQVATVQARAADLQADLAAARSTAASQAEEADRLRDQLTALRAQTTTLQADLATERSARELDQQHLADSEHRLGELTQHLAETRRERDAQARRQRKRRAVAAARQLPS
jgi:chromosome segregation ATPase